MNTGDPAAPKGTLQLSAITAPRTPIISQPLCRLRPGARAQRPAARGQRHQRLSAAVVALDGAPVWRHVGTARLTMRPFSESFLDSYLDRVGDLALQSAGCYHLEGPGAQLFVRVEGDHFTVLGLPLLELLGYLRARGVLPD